MPWTVPKAARYSRGARPNRNTASKVSAKSRKKQSDAAHRQAWQNPFKVRPPLQKPARRDPGQDRHDGHLGQNGVQLAGFGCHKQNTQSSQHEANRKQNQKIDQAAPNRTGLTGGGHRAQSLPAYNSFRARSAAEIVPSSR
jgi:hypothetical protein